jgi:hypothetical protein
MARTRSLRFVRASALAALATGACGDPVITERGSGAGATGGAATPAGTPPPGPPAPGGGGAGDFRFGEAAAARPAPGAAADAKVCGYQTHALERRPAELMLVLDRSGSMKNKLPSMNTRWAEVTAALDEAVRKTETTVHWGLKLYPGKTECTVPDGVEVTTRAGNHAGVFGAIQMTTPDGDGTPTALAVRKAAAYLQAVATRSPRYLVVATDGEPTCATGGARADADTLQALREAAAAGFKAFVVGVATEARSVGLLNQMAIAGGEPRAGDTKFYAVGSRQELVAALDAITGRITDCVFALDKAPPSPEDVAVNVGGARVGRDPTHADGWDYGAGMSSVVLYGPACDRLKSGNAGDVSIVFGCPGVYIP